MTSSSSDSAPTESITPEPGSQEWLDLVIEDVIEPDRPIIDPHHHLWPAGGALPYGLSELDADTGDGHKVVATVFVECGAAYDRTAPDHLQSVGETAFVAEEARRSDGRTGRPSISAIVANTDLRHDTARLNDVLDAHIEVGDGRTRGIRHALARAPEPDAMRIPGRAPEPDAMRIPGRAPEGLSTDPNFRAGVSLLGQRGLVFDSWHYHHQNREFAELAAACPETTIVLDHFGTPIGVGRFAGRQDEVFEAWKADIGAVAAQPNVVAKIGGMAMPDNGYGWDARATPATSDELVAAQARYYLHTIECFGPDRCMFESNFPVDRFSLSYRTVWNAFKKMAEPFFEAEKDQLFQGTAARVYNLD